MWSLRHSCCGMWDVRYPCHLRSSAYPRHRTNPRTTLIAFLSSVIFWSCGTTSRVTVCTLEVQVRPRHLVATANQPLSLCTRPAALQRPSGGSRSPWRRWPPPRASCTTSAPAEALVRLSLHRLLPEGRPKHARHNSPFLICYSTDAGRHARPARRAPTPEAEAACCRTSRGTMVRRVPSVAPRPAPSASSKSLGSRKKLKGGGSIG